MVEHVTCNDHLNTDTKTQIKHFTQQLNESLDDTNFAVEDEGEDESMFLNDIKLDTNPGIHHGDIDHTPSTNEYDDMNIRDRLDDNDDEGAINKYLNVELILDVGTNDERRGCVIKRSQGLGHFAKSRDLEFCAIFLKLFGVFVK